MFDLRATGTLVRTAWTRSDASDAFLVLDRNGNGHIDDATELFSDLSEQPPPNNNGVRSGSQGFASLQLFDNPSNGGNGDRLITEADVVYGLLQPTFKLPPHENARRYTVPKGIGLLYIRNG